MRQFFGRLTFLARRLVGLNTLKYFIGHLETTQSGNVMKQSTVLFVTAIIICLLLVASFGWDSKPTAHAESSSTDWQLSVNGLVETPLNLTLADLEAMPQTTVYADLICVGNPGLVLEQGNWTGVQLWMLLETAGVSPDAIKVAFRASDGFTTDLPITTAQQSDIVLAYAENGNPLSEVLRLVVPGEWGYKWIYMITDIELVNYNFLGTEESMGYDDNGVSPQIANVPPPHSNFATSFSSVSPSSPPQFSTTTPSPSVSPFLATQPSPTASTYPTLQTLTLISKQTSPTTNYIIIVVISILIATSTSTLILRKNSQIRKRNQIQKSSTDP